MSIRLVVLHQELQYFKDLVTQLRPVVHAGYADKADPVHQDKGLRGAKAIGVKFE